MMKMAPIYGVDTKVVAPPFLSPFGPTSERGTTGCEHGRTNPLEAPFQ